MLFASCVLIAAAILDLRCQKIPNALTFPTILIALSYAGFTRGVDCLLFSTGGMLLGMATLIVPYPLDLHPEARQSEGQANSYT